MRTLACAVLLAACGSSATTESPAAKASGDTTPPAKPAEPAGPPKRQLAKMSWVGSKNTWAHASGVASMSWCPGDEELVVLDDKGALHRYKTADGTELSLGKLATAGKDKAYFPTTIQCGADGVILSLDADAQVTLTTRDNKTTHAPGVKGASSASFAKDGSVLFIANDGVQRWRGDKVETVIPPREKNGLEALVGATGVFVERVLQEGEGPSKTYATVEGGKPIELPGSTPDMMRLAVADDGAVVVAGMMNAEAWMMRDGVPSNKPIEVLDASGTRVDDIAANDTAFYAVWAGQSVRVVQRPYMRAKMIDHVCGEAGSGTGIEAMAAPHAGPRLAIACVGMGIRIVDGPSGNEIQVAAPSSAGTSLAWSPKGDRLAIRDVTGVMRVWTGDTPSAKIKADYGDGVWWQSEGELGALSGNAVTFFKIADGSSTVDTDPQTGPVIERVAQSAHGELMYAWRPHGRDNKVRIRGGKEIELPMGKDWMNGAAIDGSATHAIVWRGDNSGTPTSEVAEVDVAKGTAAVVAVDAVQKAVALGDNGVWVAAEEGGIFAHTFGVKGEKKLSDTGKGPLKDPKVTAIAVNGDVVAVGLADGRVALILLDGSDRGILPAHDAAVTALAFSPDGKRLASSSDDGTRVFALE